MIPMNEPAAATFRPPRRRRGLTLMELMVALGVVAIALFGAVSMILHTVRAKEYTRELDVAKHAAATKLEEIRVRPWTEVSNPSSSLYQPFTVEGLNPPKTNGGRHGLARIRNLGPGGVPTNANLIDVEVTIEWIGVRGPSQYSMRSMYSP
jgi:prepilin-type N-terminal cleavage/methylation domain-containing protein